METYWSLWTSSIPFGLLISPAPSGWRSIGHLPGKILLNMGQGSFWAPDVVNPHIFFCILQRYFGKKIYHQSTQITFRMIIIFKKWIRIISWEYSSQRQEILGRSSFCLEFEGFKCVAWVFFYFLSCMYLFISSIIICWLYSFVINYHCLRT